MALGSHLVGTWYAYNHILILARCTVLWNTVEGWITKELALDCGATPQIEGNAKRGEPGCNRSRRHLKVRTVTVNLCPRHASTLGQYSSCFSDGYPTHVPRPAPFSLLNFNVGFLADKVDFPRTYQRRMHESGCLSRVPVLRSRFRASNFLPSLSCWRSHPGLTHGVPKRVTAQNPG